MFRRGFKFFLFFLIVFFSLKLCVFAESVEDPAASLNQLQETPGPAANNTDNRYTAETFDALPDAEKKNVYFNSPQMLPENFSPEAYMNILHTESNNTEN
jgi:hypothetical protein